MRRRAGLTLAVAALLPLASIVEARAKADYATQCTFEIKPKGYYTYEAGQKVPVVVPDQGGTQAEADALNACIRAKANAAKTKSTAGSMATPVPEDTGAPSGKPSRKASAATAAASSSYTKKQRGSAVLSGGAGYHGSYLEGGTGRGFVGTASGQPVKVKRVRRGMTPPPSGYPLLPGDEELWYSLTPAQQERAAQFLKDGSTIRSSLQAD
jgi:hypothetical protein